MIDTINEKLEGGLLWQGGSTELRFKLLRFSGSLHRQFFMEVSRTSLPGGRFLSNKCRRHLAPINASAYELGFKSNGAVMGEKGRNKLF